MPQCTQELHLPIPRCPVWTRAIPVASYSAGSGRHNSESAACSDDLEKAVLSTVKRRVFAVSVGLPIVDDPCRREKLATYRRAKLPAQREQMYKIYQFKITLKGTSPPIWRRVQVPGDFHLSGLHYIIQTSMGWENIHLFNFTVGDVRYDDSEESGDPSVKDASETSISDAFTRKGVKGVYIYDFGDGWKHEVLVESIMDPDPSIEYPICIDGKRRCPPEDCGGVSGYYRLLSILKDLTHEEYDDVVEWVGDDIDPERFDCEDVNRIMSSREGNSEG